MPRVLVCESERHISRLIEANLERQGHEVLVFPDGASCLRVLREFPVEVLVIGEPEGMSVEEILLAIQEDPGIDVKVLVLRKQGEFPDLPQGPFGGSPHAVVSSVVELPTALFV